MADPLSWSPVGHPEGLEITPDPKDGGLLPANITPAAPGSFRAAQEETGPRQATSDEIWGAAFRQENEIVGALNPVVNFGDPDPDHNPLDAIEGTPHEDFWHRFIGSRNQKETDFIIATLQRELQDRQILAAGGYLSIPATIAASILSPTTLLPAGAIYKSAKLFGAAAKSAGAVGAAAGGSAALQELLLQNQQLTRTAGESAVAVGGSVILGGILGGAASSLGSAQLARLAAGIESLEALARRPSIEDPFGHGGLKAMMGESSAGAAQVTKPAVELESTGGLASLPVVRAQDPVIRILNSPSRVLREVGVNLFETVLATTRNRDGITTAPAGGAVETRIKTQGDAPLGQALRITDEKFAEYYFGKPAVPFATARATIGEYMHPTGKLTHKQFREEVTQALWNKDKHDIAEVAAAAKALREFFDRIVDRSIEVGHLDAATVARRRPTGQSTAAPKQTGGPRVLHSGATPEQKAAFEAITAIERALGKAIPDEYFDDLILFMASGRPEALALTQAVEKFTKVENLALKLQLIGKTEIPKADLRLIRKVLDNDEQALAEFTQKTSAAGKEANPAIRSYWTRLYQDAKTVVDELGYADAVKFMADPEKFRQQAQRDVSNRWRMVQGVIEARGGVRAEFEKNSLDPELQAEIFGTKDESYAPFLYMRERIAKQRNRFVGLIAEHLSNSQARAMHVIRRLEQEAGSAEAAGMKVNAKLQKSIDDLRGFTDIEEAELKSIAHDITDKIMGTPEGRVWFELPAAVRGPLKARTLNIPASFESPKFGRFQDFLEKDSDVLARMYMRTVVPDNELMGAFGSLDLREPLARIKEDFQRLFERIDAANEMTDKQKEAARAALARAQERGIKDFLAISERLRGTYQMPEDPMAFLPRLGRSLRTLNFMRLLGGMTVSAMTDIPRIMMTQGALTTFRDGVVPLLNNIKAVKLSANETKLAGTALDMVLNTRAMAIADVMDDYGRYSKFERALGSMQDKFGTLALMNPWNAAMKQWVGMVVQTKVLRAAMAVADGNAKPRWVKQLAESGISPDDARIIAEQYRLFGAKHGNVYLPNTLDWNTADPAVRNALESFRGAIVRDVDRTVVTPGQDKPLWMSTEVGKMVGQFKSFGIATVQRTMMAGLQQRDAGVAMGMMMMLGLGVIVEHMKALTNKKELPKTNAQWIATAIDRSGLTGWMFEVNHFAESVTGGTVGIGALTGRKVSRYASRNWADSVLGPTGGLAKDLFQGSGGLFRQGLKGEQINESDVRALRRSLPYQNLFYLSWLFRELEGASSRSLGAKPMKKNSLM